MLKNLGIEKLEMEEEKEEFIKSQMLGALSDWVISRIK